MTCSLLFLKNDHHNRPSIGRFFNNIFIGKVNGLNHTTIQYNRHLLYKYYILVISFVQSQEKKFVKIHHSLFYHFYDMIASLLTSPPLSLIVMLHKLLSFLFTYFVLSPNRGSFHLIPWDYQRNDEMNKFICSELCTTNDQRLST